MIRSPRLLVAATSSLLLGCTASGPPAGSAGRTTPQPSPVELEVAPSISAGAPPPPSAAPTARPTDAADFDPKTAIAAPIAPSARLMPCRVELEHKLRDVAVSDDTWKTVRVPVRSLVRVWETPARHEIDWVRSPIAPVPLTIDQARAMPKANEDVALRAVLRMFDDSTLTYTFDPLGRTVEVDFDPVADSSVYHFRYEYDCRSKRPKEPVVWVDP